MLAVLLRTSQPGMTESFSSPPRVARVSHVHTAVHPCGAPGACSPPMSSHGLQRKGCLQQGCKLFAANGEGFLHVHPYLITVVMGIPYRRYTEDLIILSSS